MYWLTVPRPLRLLVTVATPLWTALSVRVDRTPFPQAAGVVLIARKPG